MKKASYISFIFMTLFILSASAAVPEMVNYQGYLKQDGVVVTGTKNMAFSLYGASSGGALLCTSGAQSVAVTNGLFSYKIGSAGCDLSTINWDNPVYIEVAVDGVTMTPREQIAGMSYLVQTLAADVAFTPAGNVAATDVQSAIDELDSEKLDLTGGTVTGTITATAFAGDGSGLTGISAAALDHNTMGNLTVGDPHTQYFNLSQAETVAAIPAFNGGKTGVDAPFTVDSTFLVSNLNADLLDGQEGAYYLNTGTSMSGDVSGIYSNIQIGSDVVGSTEVTDASLTAADLLVNVASSVDGVTNDGGDIDLVAGAGITLTPNDGANTITIAGDFSVVDHGSISGLGDDDHTQYFALAQNETVSGIAAFDGGTSGVSAPFTVDSTFVVANLNADQLDGQEGTYYLNTGTAHSGDVTGAYNTLDIASGVIGSTEITDASLTAADLLVNVASSVDGVTNDGGDIDLVAGAGVTITPNDGANTITIAGDFSVVDHGSITGLGDDDHTQYFALAQNETVSGIPAFDGGTSGVSAPFTVDSTFLVTNLNADLLDGNDSAAFMSAGTDNWVNITGDTMTGALAMSGANGDITFDNAGGNITLAAGGISDSAGNVNLSDNVYVSGNVGIGTATPANTLDVEGAAAIGATYSGASAAPVNSLIVEGSLGIGTSNPASGKLQIDYGGATAMIYGTHTGAGGNLMHLRTGAADTFVVDHTGNITVAGGGNFTGLSATSNGNPGTELRSTAGGQPYIDFSNDGVIDRDVRIILSGDDLLSITDGDLSVSGSITSGCLAGFISVAGNFCILSAALGPSNWYTASDNCRGFDARLCLVGEQFNACRAGGIGFVNGPSYWVDETTGAGANPVSFSHGSATCAGNPALSQDAYGSNNLYYCCRGK